MKLQRLQKGYSKKEEKSTAWDVILVEGGKKTVVFNFFFLC